MTLFYLCIFKYFQSVYLAAVHAIPPRHLHRYPCPPYLVLNPPGRTEIVRIILHSKGNNLETENI